MRQLTRVISCTAAVLAMAACGSQSASTGSGSPPSQPTVFPVTVTRTGGLAGFQDVVVVADNGLVSVMHKGQQERHCQLTPEAVERLRTAASQVPWPRITPAGTQPAFPDDMVSMVQSPAGGPVRLEDPSVGAAGKVFQELLTDVSGGASAPLLCKAA
jgi:hypothetical protein